MLNLAFDLPYNKVMCNDSLEPHRGYQLIKSFSIENFRCFERLDLENLSTINILVGDNGSGKTAILEALLLSAYAHPRAALLIRQLRNRPLPLPFPSTQGFWDWELFQTLWEDLFFDSTNSKKIVASFCDSLAGEIQVEISYEEPEQQPALFSGWFTPTLAFKRQIVSQNSQTTQATKIKLDVHGNPVYEGLANMAPPIYILPSTSQFSAQDVVNYFSSLSRQNLEHQLIGALRREFPEITDITIVIDVNVPGLFATVKSSRGQKLPLSVVSSGAARYLNILAAITSLKHGVVLVDEIENGIYWKKLPNIWKTLRDICTEKGVQLFATTHSNECLQSLIEPMQGHEDDFSLIRTVFRDGASKVKQFPGKTFLAALKQHGEIR